MMDLRFLSLFSGLEAASLAWNPLGWRCAGVSEIDPFACALLREQHPEVPNLGDVTAITEEQVAALGRLDVLVFGSPCQDLSVAGKRAGLAGERSGLFHDATRIIRWARKHNGLRFALWENVPGALSSHRGRDFAAVLVELSGLAGIKPPPAGWGSEGAVLGPEGLVEWASLDAQWFGLAQRRERVFALADFGDWANRPAVLLEPESLRGDPPARGRSREDAAGTLAGGSRIGGGYSEDDIPHVAQAFDVANTLTRRMGKGINTTVDEGQTPVLSLDVAHALRAEGFDASEDGTGRGTPLVPEVLGFNARQDPDSWPGVTGPLDTDGHTQAIAFDCKASGRNGFGVGEVPPTLRAMGHKDGHSNGGGQVAALSGLRVRRLTPRECERLQGVPDDYTRVMYRKKPAADGPRYKALGNSMARDVMEWIGRRIEAALAP
jgi:DNA (cytosine-5)-methyltransferase 1